MGGFGHRERTATRRNSIIQSLTVSQYRDWHFMSYFDDSFNFLEFPNLNSLFPININHMKELISHNDINVFEPAATVLKAAEISFVGLIPRLLRVCSVCFHALNVVILIVQLRFLYFIHPLNMEVAHLIFLVTIEHNARRSN